MRRELPVFARFAARSFTRNTRRSILSLAGIVIGCGVALINIAGSRGKINLFLRNVAEGGVGHFKVLPRGWEVSHDPLLRLAEWQYLLSQLQKMPEVGVATPRARVQAMLAMGTRMTGVEVVGVDPKTEPQSFRYVRTVQAGRYLEPGDSHKMVIGKAIADRLRVEVGDAVVVTAVNRKGEVQNEMFDVLGIVDLGSKNLETSICQVNLPDIESLSGLKGVGELAVLLKDPENLSETLSSIRPLLGQSDQVLSWDQIRPESKVAIDLNVGMARILTVILIFVAFVGVASAQLTAILERQREIAVLSAIGMTTQRTIALLISEALLMGTVSWVLTVGLIGPLVRYYAVVGIRVLSKGHSMNAVGTVVDPIFHADFGLWFFTYAAGLTYFSTLAATLYPALLVARLNPAEALRVAQ